MTHFGGDVGGLMSFPRKQDPSQMKHRWVAMAQQQVNLVDQHDNIGITQGINYGDNQIFNYYANSSSSNLRLTPSQFARQTHEKWRAVWKGTGTCEWLLKRSKFSGWLQMENKHSFLWIHGLQGCGKTTLMSRAIEYIREERIDVRRLRDAHLLYFYIGYGNDKETQQFYRDMLMAFWEQVIAKDGARASDLFGTSTSDEEIHEKLNSHLASSQRDVYIVIDALDQLPLPEQRKLLNGLDALFRKHKAGQSNFRIAAIISSRDRTGCDRLQTHKLCEIHIKPSDSADDIRNYLEKNLNSYLFDDQPALRERVLSELIHKADGMFLWAKLQRANICDMDLEEDVEHALQTLLPPGEMRQIYQDYAERFESLEKPTEKQIALRAMALLAYTAELIPKEVLLVALALDIKNGKPNPKTYKELSEEPAKVVRICHHLIEMNENLGAFRFCHGSVYEFFRHYQPVKSHRRIAELCLAHICASDFSQGPHSSAEWYNYGSLGPVLREHKFLEFASCNWAISMKQSIESDDDRTSIKTTHKTIIALLQKLFGTAEARAERRNLQLSFQVYLLSIRKSKPMPGGVCLEHIVSYFALFAFFDVFHQRRWLDLKKCDHEGSTSIHWAIRNQTEKDTAHVIDMLINYGSDVNAQDTEGRTPLYYAAHYGRFDVMRLLLDGGANLDIQSRTGETALIAACKEHHEETVLELIKAGADVQVQGPLGTALQAVSLIGCDRCAKRILDQYETASTITETNGPYGTSLHAAAFHGHHKVVELLLRTNKFDVRTTNETYGNILTAAASGCARTMDPTPFHNIFEQAIAQGADTNDTSGFFGPPLRAAAANGHSTLVRILLDNGAKVSVAQGLMGTAYFAAEIQGYEDIRQLLMQSDPNAAMYGSVDSKNTLSILHDVWRKMFGVAMAAGNAAILNGVIGQVEGLFKKTIQIENMPVIRMMAYVGAGFFNDVVKLATSSSSETETYAIENILRGGAITEEVGEKEGLEHTGLKEEKPEPRSNGRETLEEHPTESSIWLHASAGEKTRHGPLQEALTSYTRGEEMLMEYSRQGPTDSESQTTSEESNPRKSLLLRISCCLCITDSSDEEDRETPSSQVFVDPRSPLYLSNSLVKLPEQPTSELIAAQNQIQVVTQSDVVGLEFPSDTATERRYSTSKVAMAGMQSAFEFATTIVKKERAMSIGAISRRSSILSSMSKRAYSFTPSFLKRQDSPSFRQSNFEGHFPEVFDRLTLAAANILESAIWTGNSEMIRIIAERWVDSLNKLISLPNFGEPMIERVVNERARLFKEILIDPALGTDERFRGAVGIARVGVELLFTAIRLGPKYKKLCLVLAKLWVFGLIRVEELEEEGQKQVWKLIEIYTAKFAITTESKDQLHTGLWADVAVEVLRASVSYPNKRVLHKITRECVKQWYRGIECQMGDVMLGLLIRKWVEFQRCVIGNRRNEAVSLAVVGMGLLQAAIQQRIDAVVERLLPRVIEGFEWSLGLYDDNIMSISEIEMVDQFSTAEEEEEEWEGKQSELASPHNYHSQEEGRENGDREMVEAIVSLFAVTEVYDPDRLRLLALRILDSIEAISDERRQVLTSILHQRIQVTRKGTHSPELQLQLMHISTAIVYFLNVVLVEETNEPTKTTRPRTLVALKSLAGALPPNMMARDDFSRYEKAISVFRS